MREGLSEAGYVEGENLAIEYRWGGGHQDRLRGLADDLIRHNVSLISEDPVKTGFVRQLNRPGGTTTGVTFLSNTLRTKQLELLHELVPNASVSGMLVNSKIPVSKDHISEQEAAARAWAEPANRRSQ